MGGGEGGAEARVIGQEEEERLDAGEDGQAGGRVEKERGEEGMGEGEGGYLEECKVRRGWAEDSDKVGEPGVGEGRMRGWVTRDAWDE